MSPQPTPPPAYWSPSTDEGWIVDSDGVLFEATIVGDPIVLPADAVRLIPVHDDTGEHLARAQGREIARVTAERDEARAGRASFAEEVRAGAERLHVENTQLRAQRAANLADLRAAAQDLRTIGVLVNEGRSPAYELAAERVDQVIARIHHRAGETTDAS